MPHQPPVAAPRAYPSLVYYDIERTVDFYSSVLGMEAIAWQPSSDDPSFTHVYLHAGEGAIITFTGPAEPGRTVLARGRMGVGSLHHLVLQIDSESFATAPDRPTPWASPTPAR